MNQPSGPFDMLKDVVGESEIPAPGHITSVWDIAAAIANFMTLMAAGLAIAGLAYAFVQYATSQGDPKAVDRAQKAVTGSVVAFVVTFLLWSIRRIIIGTLTQEGVYIGNDPGI
ncbi:hypothetical protein A3K34_04495 [candidate division WWE3 bacterium RIFOXYC1_FULL_40_10]|uniref:Uncharacterized protein n=1 Tax=candidate division WWE3 bacterium RIFOXYA2_FULL_46_9 TaxID=1802636 RepID=A0A1F4W118_UNCKA|nr:MAG: hypothetical protein A3K58_04495 [candidate division WWE3 bacterium RIFOXYB1_FULL_40_22]OGC62102.1 MAG: hypothetical protein A3K37_04495 [candidate division WWE3 bacterium RIFOXYA1_FULL_40_11]OGC63117.1 MAG: hypothetical protein A2264_00240 [candidate division WWE3 bacterium RIFOXYA2_FULL_46_9]OGC64955.1 MAG: hypothetical protein A2326_02870 [candidate division WWE3 bacterium RIFOXYB2_FULL_41_6]OGC66485.1 MAG: hypothetical protein A3K34_04495 [candidate division WWE3 bacterium RIFOXYC1_